MRFRDEESGWGASLPTRFLIEVSKGILHTTMVLKVALGTTAALIALSLMVLTYLAATGQSFQIDFTSPGPISLPSERPQLQASPASGEVVRPQLQAAPATLETDAAFRFAQ